MLLRFSAILIFLSLSFSCASYRGVPQQYAKVVSPQEKSKTDKTVLFFLVDGLPIFTLKQELQAGKMPSVDSYFLGSKKQIYIARTEFPSVTFTGITGLLTEKPVSANGIFGNQILSGDQIVNLEQISNYTFLNDQIHDKNIFSRLKKKGSKTVSYSYSFYGDADVHTDLIDLPTGLSILNFDYEFADRKSLDSLQYLLTQTGPEAWPDFIFVHLVGVEFISHQRGPASEQVVNYLAKLDQELGPIFEILNWTEKTKQRKIMAFLSSDHGFDRTITTRIDLKDLLGPEGQNLKVVNESRYAGLYFPSSWSLLQRTDYLKKISAQPSIEFTVQSQKNEVIINNHVGRVTFTYSAAPCAEGNFAISVQKNLPVCPENLSSDWNYLYHPYFIANLSHYFQAKNVPDALILPQPGTSFGKTNLGQHGGPSIGETQVPLLIHNGALTQQKSQPKLYELLRFL